MADLIAMAQGLRREHVGKCPLNYDHDEWWRENGGPGGHECARWCGAAEHNARVDALVAELRSRAEQPWGRRARVLETWRLSKSQRVELHLPIGPLDESLMVGQYVEIRKVEGGNG